MTVRIVIRELSVRSHDYHNYGTLMPGYHAQGYAADGRPTDSVWYPDLWALLDSPAVAPVAYAPGAKKNFRVRGNSPHVMTITAAAA